jgi:phenylpropionate dioxygenase-like ring-hydroxylating dioxygenase large terminal subunit
MIETPEQLDKLLAEIPASLNVGLLPAWVIADETAYKRELDRIFTRAWIFVGHETEIPSRGDYVHRSIGRDAFVLVRGEDGEIRLLFDSCRHRGAMVCRASKGNASHFRCSYHGWTYKNTGEWVGAPVYRAAYGENFDRRQWGLLNAPHVESLHGFVFASLDPEAPSLTEYLGDMKWYFDMMYGQAVQGWEVLGEPQRWVMDANWKTGADNFSGDDYHTLFLHRSIKELGLLGLEEDEAGLNASTHIQASNGHSISHWMLPPGIPDAPRFWMWPNADELFKPLQGEDKFAAAELTIGNVGTIFPTFSYLSFPLQQVLETGPLATNIVRTWQPRSATEVAVWNWIMAPKGLTEEQKLATKRAALGTFGSSGIFDQDDSEPWHAITQMSSSPFVRKVGMPLNYAMGLDGSGGVAERVDGNGHHPGPGVKYSPAFEEGVMRGFYRRWTQFMRSERYPEPMSAEEQNGGTRAQAVGVDD